MANQKISQFPSVTPPLSGDEVPVIRGAANKRISLASLKAFINAFAFVKTFNGRGGDITLRSSDLNGLSGDGLVGGGTGTGGVQNPGSTTVGADDQDEPDGIGVVALQTRRLTRLEIANDGEIIEHGRLSGANLADVVGIIGGARKTLRIATPQTLSADLAIPSTLTLEFTGTGSIDVDGFHLEIGGTIVAPQRQIFLNAAAGAGTVKITGNRLRYIFPEWWGALFDDATDDQPPIQAAIDSLGSTAGMRCGPEIIISGRAAIADTVLMNRKSFTFSALGWGRQGQTGPQSYLRWIGSAGIPMLRLQNWQGLEVKKLRLIGNASSKPSCAISLYEELFLGNMGKLNDIAIGDLADSTTIGEGFENGILWEGALGNNAEWQWSNISIVGCSEYGIRQNCIQNVNCRIDGLQIANCGTGLYAVGAMVGSNWNFSSNGVDVEFPTQDDTPSNASPRVRVNSFYSELSGRLLVIGGTGILSIDNGQFQVGSFTNADGKIVVNNNEGNPTIALRNFSFPEVSTPTTAPFFFMKSPPGEHSLKTIILDGIDSWLTGGPDGTGLDVATSGTLDQRYIVFRSNAVREVGGNATPFASVNWIFGDFFGGETFEFGRFDIPSRLRLVPERFGQEIDAAGDTILHDYANKIIFNDSGSSITLTSTPTVPDGVNGEVMRLINVGPDNLVLQDQGTLAGSNLRLTANTVTIPPRCSIEVTFLTLVGDWVQTGPLVSPL